MGENENTFELYLPNPSEIQLFDESEMETIEVEEIKESNQVALDSQEFEEQNSDLSFEYIIISKVLNDPTYYFKLKNLGLTVLDFTFKETIDLWEKIESISDEGITERILLDQYFKESQNVIKELIIRINRVKYDESEIDYAVRKLKENSLRRELLNIGYNMKQNALDKDKDINESYSDVISRLLKVEQFDEETQEFNAKEVLKALESNIRERIKGNEVQGVKTGIDDLDANIGCYYYGLTNVIVASVYGIIKVQRVAA